jgi:cell shape-determining protein MreC
MPLYTPGRRRAIILLLLSSVLLLTLDLRGNAVFDAARTGFTKVVDPFEAAADVVTKPIRNAWHGIADYEDVAQENERLREQLDAQRADQVAAQAAILDYQALLALNNLPSLGDYPTVPAMVVGESASNLDQVIEINKGRDDGIEVGMAVVSRAGLVGKITAPVLPDRSFVMLVTDDRYATGVKVVPGAPPETTTTTLAPEAVPPGFADPAATPATDPSTTTTSTPTPPSTTPESTTSTSTSTTTTTIDVSSSRDTGQLMGQGAGRLPQVDLLQDTPVFGRIVPGDIVLTAGGTEGLAPPDIPVGVVKNVISRSSAEGPLLEIEPLADFGRLQFVRVVLYKPESEVEQTIDTQAGD